MFRCCVTQSSDDDVSTIISQHNRFDRAQFIEDCLHQHNYYRNQHGCHPLHISAKLCGVAQEWAKKLARDDSSRHSYRKECGENLYTTYYTNHSGIVNIKGPDPVDKWYSEHWNYRFGDQGTLSTLSKAGHFTQVVWKATKELGIGADISKSSKIYVVANYEPPGNKLGHFEENVPKKRENSTSLAPPHLYIRRISSRRLSSTLIHLD